MKRALKATMQAALPAPAGDFLLRWWRRVYWWRIARPSRRRTRRATKALLQRGGPIKLELGGGPRLGMEGWTSVDLQPGATIQHDLRAPLPLPENSVDAIYSSHLIEHFSYPEPMLSLLRECHRLLRPGGTLKVAVPNARLFLQAYLDASEFDQALFCTEDVGLDYTCRIDFVNFIAYLGGEHRFMFDEDNLPYVLKKAGFAHVALRNFDDSVDVPRRRHESLYAVAVK